MKTSYALICVALLASANAPAACAQVNYVLHQIPLSDPFPNDGVNHNGMNQIGMVVGSHYPGGVKTGFVYDHFGLIGAPRSTHSITEWMNFPSPWFESSCVGINDIGQIVGFMQSVDGQQIGFLLDLDVFSATPAPAWQYLPSPLGARSSYGRRINNNGLVLMESSTPFYGQYLLDSTYPAAEPVEVVYPGTNVPITSIRFEKLNDSGQLAGAGEGAGHRLTPGSELKTVLGANSAKLNSLGELGLNLYPVLDKRGRIITPDIAARWSDSIGLQPISNSASTARDINDSGDVCGYNNGQQNPAIYQEGFGWVYLDEVVTGSVADLSLWFDAKTDIKLWYISNRNATGFGSLFATAIRTTTTGKGKSAITTTVIKHYLLEPTQ